MKKLNSKIMRAMMDAGIKKLSKEMVPSDGYLKSLHEYWDIPTRDKWQVDIIHDTRFHSDPYIMVYHFPKATGAAVSATHYLGPVFVNTKTGKVKTK